MPATPNELLGRRFYDITTRFEGTCTEVSYHLGGHIELKITDGVDGGKILEFWFPYSRLEEVV